MPTPQRKSRVAPRPQGAGGDPARRLLPWCKSTIDGPFCPLQCGQVARSGAKWESRRVLPTVHSLGPPAQRRRPRAEGIRLVFTGEYRHTVDDKGRIAVPAKFRAQLAAGASSRAGWIECLAIHTRAGWDDLAAKVAALPITDQASRRLPAVHLRRAHRGRGRPPGPDPRCRPTCASRRPRRRRRGRRVARPRRDLGPDRWDRYAQALDDPRRWPRPSKGSGSSVRHHMRFQGPLGIRSTAVEER
jgi:hypothetical protein